MAGRFESSILILLVISFCSCTSHPTQQENESGHEIDSLINIDRLTNNVILVSFGADAITAINTNKGIVVVDAGISSGLTSRFRKIIEIEFQKSDFRYIINTHGHSDHYGGNSVFREAKVIAQINSLDEITEQWKDTSRVLMNLEKIVWEYDTSLNTSAKGSPEWSESFTQKNRYLCTYNDVLNKIPIKLPEITFSDTLTFDLEDVKFEMFYFGACHSKSDILIYVPEYKILFTGDLFSGYGRPSINSRLNADTDKWKSALQWTTERVDNIGLIIGGHGQIFTKNELMSFNKNIQKRIYKL